MSRALPAAGGAMPGMVSRADAGPARSAGDALRRHWPDYLIETWGLGRFTVSAGAGAPARPSIPPDDALHLGRALMALSPEGHAILAFQPRV